MFISILRDGIDRFNATKATARICAAVLAIGFTALAAAEPVAISDFVKRSKFSNPSLSPDGEHLVVTNEVQNNGRTVNIMVIYHLADMKIVNSVQLPVFELPGAYEWVGPRRLVVMTARDRGTLQVPQLTGEIQALDIDGSRQEYLYGTKPGVRKRRVMAGDEGNATFQAASQDEHVFIAEYPWGLQVQPTLLYDIDSASAARHLVTKIDKEYADFLVSRTGKPLFAYAVDDNLDTAVYRFDEANGKWIELGGADKGNLFPVRMSPDEKSFIATVGTAGGPRSLVRQSAEEGGGRTVLASDPLGNMDMIEWGPRPRQPFAVATSLDIPKARVFDESRQEGQLYKLLAAQFPSEYLHFVNFSNDGSKLLFRVSSDRNPGDYFLFDRATSKASLLFSAMPWIDPARMAPTAAIKFNARDGLELHGYLTMPKTMPADGKPPLILMPHGGPEGVFDEWFYDPDTQFLASRGYAVLQVNYRGSGGRGAKFEKLNYREWGGKMQDDLIDGVRWVVQQGSVDGNRMCTYGGSYGAYSALMSTIRAPGLFKCAVGYAGLYDLARIYDEDGAVWDKNLRDYYVRAVGKDPAVLASISPAQLADKLTVPILLVHGSADKTTPPVQAKTMREALIKAGHPPEWMYVEDEGHGFYAEKSRQAFYEKLESFLAKNLAK